MAEPGTTYPVADLVEYFTGRWILERDIVDGSGAPAGTFTGSATFCDAGEGLIYAEQGTLQLGTYRGSAYRRLYYHLTGPGRAAVYFDYGDFFHELDLRGGHWQTRHPCRDDLYRGEFRVQGPDRWQQWWTVAGPTKNHSMTTSFRRATDDATVAV
ncbi:DUF6314 family protein [Haloactinomyces albus]|uniref:DUF6314 domain-containing protein n=1 Tax=Haloactinomyces albus TaxID=1352928 RepID=A0AAE4CK41_9ACTN|nr:DUF6314 family protein [Haloactinomyces albus]MDR7299906.1 hypothetical protein [Haloactinomyces albus]